MIYDILKAVLVISRTAKLGILLAVDSIFIIGSLWLSFSFSLNDWYWPIGSENNSIVSLVLFSPVIAVPVFAYFGLYRTIIRSLSEEAIWTILRAVMVYGALWALVVFLSGVEMVPRSILFINAIVIMLCIGGSRLFACWLLRKIEDVVYIRKIYTGVTPGVFNQSRVVIFGAGAAGRQLAVGLLQTRECVLLAFVDDAIELHRRELMGVPILSQKQLETFVGKKNVDNILLAIPSISHKQRRLIIESLLPLNTRIRILPGVTAMARGQADYTSMHELDINDLLAREPAASDEVMLQEQVTDQTIMVTGAGGSIGSELCRQILLRKPKSLLLYELNEFSLFTLHNELLETLQYIINEESHGGALGLAPTIIPLLGSVADESRVNDVLLTWQPSVIYHAAAIKHVPIVEHNIAECVKNNVLGTLVLVKVAIAQNVQQVVLVSTDKAVNPTNAMGASKRCCELILQALAVETNPLLEPIAAEKPSVQVAHTTQLGIVRFGNVLGSSGSVVPHFRKQIANGGPITLTHKDITRYFMTIPEAAQLVMQTGAMMAQSRNGVGAHSDNGEANVYVLDMGDPVEIYDLARRMVKLSGFRVKDENSPEGDIAIDVVGLRPGEKLFEELLVGNNPQKTQHPRIMKANEKFLPWRELEPLITELRVAAENGDVIKIRTILKLLVPEYKPNEKVVDWVYQEQIAQSEMLKGRK